MPSAVRLRGWTMRDRKELSVMCDEQADLRRDAANMESALNTLAAWVREARGMDAYKSRSRVYDLLSNAHRYRQALRYAEAALERIAFRDATTDPARVYREATACLQDRIRPAFKAEGSAD